MLGCAQSAPQDAPSSAPTPPLQRRSSGQRLATPGRSRPPMQTSAVVGRSRGAIRHIQVVIVEASTLPYGRKMTAIAAIKAAPKRVFPTLFPEATARNSDRAYGEMTYRR